MSKTFFTFRSCSHGERLGGAILFALGTLALLLLWRQFPTHYSFIPPCVFHSLTGLECPGCGGLRGTHHLLHGRLAEAWAYNPLAVIIMPLLVLFQINNGTIAATGRTLVLPWSRYTWVLALALFLGFGFLRNLPFSCFDSLRPPPNPPGSR